MITKFYKGYTELRNKVPTSKRKSRVIRPEWQEVGGYLADEYVLVDIDDSTNVDLFFTIINDFHIRCHVTESRHGIHAIFRKPTEQLAYGNRKETLTGVICDYKCTSNNGYERIIIDREPLPVINECDNPDILPWLLFPFGRARGLQDMQAGDGRHKVLMDLSNVYAIYERDPHNISIMLNWVNEKISIADIQDSISYMNKNYTDTEFYDMIRNVDKNKVLKLLVQYGVIK